MFRFVTRICFLSLFLVLGACAGRWQTNYENPLNPEATRTWTVSDVVVTVPAEATTTESNTFAPSADIVWHGEEYGNRKAQVAAIVEEGLRAGASAPNGPRSVTLVALVTKFHGVTPLAVARAPQAVHNIEFQLQVVDSTTGEAITQPFLVDADLEAHVGAAAITAALQGRDQRTRIVSHIAAVTRGILGYGPDQRREFVGLGR